MTSFSKEIILEAKEYYRKDFMKTRYKGRRNKQLKNLISFDAYIEFQNGVGPLKLAAKYKYPFQQSFGHRLNITRARICIYIKLKELGNV